MDWILTMPIGFRLLFLFVIGMILGSFLNWAIYQLCYNPRKISPWSAPEEKAPKRHWTDRLPFIGWLGLAREGEIHGKLFWVRPMLIELACGVGLAWLYLWEIEDKGLHDWVLAVIPPTFADLHVQFLSHVVLFALLIAATFIDLDEKTIPDAITVPGTLVGLLFAGLWPASLLPDYPTSTGAYTTCLLYTSPSPRDATLSRMPSSA